MTDLISKKIYAYPTKSINITNIHFKSCLLEFYDIVYGISWIKNAKSFCAGMFSVGVTTLVSYFTVSFVDKLGISGHQMEQVYLFGSLLLIGIGLLGFLVLGGIKVSGYSKKKKEVVDQYVDNELGLWNKECEIYIKNESDGIQL